MLELLFALFVCLITFLLVRHKRQEALVKHLPGPPSFPFIGNGLLFIGKTPEEILKTVERLTKEYGSIFRIFLGSELGIMLSDPKDVEVLLSSQVLIEKADEYDIISEWLGTGLLISTGRKWFTHRKAITPAFHFQILEQFVKVFDENGSIFVKNLAKFKDQEFDVFPFIALYALDVICETSMGVELHAQTNSESKYVKAVKDISGVITTRHYNFLLRENWIFRLTPLYRKQKELLEILHDFTNNVILTRREELLKAKNSSKEILRESDDDDGFGCKKKMALLDILLQSTINCLPLSNTDIREEVDTFMFEGHDTTTTGIAFCLYNLAKYPEEQKKVFTEIHNMIGDDLERSFTLKDLNSLNYLEVVIKESLRLFPPVPFFGRKIRKDFQLNGKMIPKNSNLGVNAIFMGRDPKIFTDPESFKPERFLAENLGQNSFAYIPFSAGPRNCIGQKFAMLEMKSIISKVLQNFEIKLGKNFEPTLVAEMILRPSNGIVLHLAKRNH